MNDDGSVDLYFGPKARLASKITADDGDLYFWFRLYAPGEAFWTKTFELPDVELVK